MLVTELYLTPEDKPVGYRTITYAGGQYCWLQNHNLRRRTSLLVTEP